METANSNFGQELSNADGCQKPTPIGGMVSNVTYQAKLREYQRCMAEQQAAAGGTGSTNPPSTSTPVGGTPSSTFGPPRKDTLSDTTIVTDKEAISESQKQGTATTSGDANSTSSAGQLSDNKLLGMPKPVAYGVIVLGLAALAFGGYKTYKHFKK